MTDIQKSYMALDKRKNTHILKLKNKLEASTKTIQELTAREAKLIESLECIASVTGSEEQRDRFWLERCVVEAQATLEELRGE